MPSLPSESLLKDCLNALRFSLLHLRMQVLTDHAHFKKLMMVYERLLRFVMNRHADMILDLVIQVREGVHRV
jgi:hypothetical protein